MNEMRLADISIREDARSVRLTGVVERTHPANRFDLYFEFPTAYREFISESADAFAAAMLLPAMRAGERLEIVPPVSPGFTFQLQRIRNIFHNWFPEFARVEIVTSGDHAGTSGVPAAAASFYSGGVDSFYTLLRYRHDEVLPVPLTHSIFMRGIETELERTRGVEASERHAIEVANATGVQCIVGETNLRSHFPIDWEARYMGSALAATGLALGRGLGYVCIPSSYTYRDMVIGGSTPLTDEMFSTPNTRILHDGADTPRPQKVERIVRWRRDLVLSHLRVCSRNFGGTFNCGECYKCVRTAIALEVLGIRTDSGIFTNSSTTHWGRVALTDKLSLIEENLEFARQHRSEAHLIDLLRRVVRRRRSRDALRALARNTPLEHLLWLAPKRWLR